jgi:hypothetical protein
VFAFAHLLLPFLGSILNAVVTFATGQFSGSRSDYPGTARNLEPKMHAIVGMELLEKLEFEAKFEQ